MKHEKIIEKIKIPEGVECSVSGNSLFFKNGNKEINRKIPRRICAKVVDEELTIESEIYGRKGVKLIRTLEAHIKNILRGFNENFTYKLKICAVHFPMNVSIDKEKSEIVIKNFLGETRPRRAKIRNKTEVRIEKDEIIISSYDKESAGQTAANIEKSTKVKSRDRRVFQDGIYLTEKGGKVI
jgi:large subunit ribosomal protein L6